MWNISSNGILNKVNTKARRLGYVKLLINFLQNDSGKHGFPLRFGNYALKYNNQLISYKNYYGKIDDNRNIRNSALPYIQLSESLQLIEKRNKQYISRTNAQFLSIHDVFNLSNFEKLFFLSLLISKDWVSMLIIFSLASSKSHSYKELCFEYNNLIFELIDRIQETHFLSPYINSLVAVTDNELAKDSFILPRLHWYYDLDLVDLRYSLSQSNREMLSEIRLINRGMEIYERATIYLSSEEQVSENEINNTLSVLAKDMYL